MKKIVLSTAAVAVAVVAAACSSGSKSASKTVASGTYTVSNASASPDTCTIGARYDAAIEGQTIDVIGSSTDIKSDFGFFVSPADCALTGLACDTGVLQGPSIDFTNTGASGLTGVYQCTDNETFEVTGTVTGHNAFTYGVSMNIAKTAGTDADCVVAENSEYGLTIANGFTFPCSSTATANAKM